MSDAVFDASVVLAAILREPGGMAAQELDAPALVSTVNYAEVRSKLSELGLDRSSINEALEMINMNLIDFDAAQAELAADLRASTRSLGLSLGDRCCLALAISRSAIAVTADRSWERAEVPVEIRLVR
ncbi:MAG: type II toxin-antitoxin system VapC family toxin [Devosia sp.]|nr:type II toxin-antitoxin system VapC family toxin [Devosia sp.]